MLDDIATRNREGSDSTAIQNGKIRLYFKCENLQQTGSFKYRGASHFIARLQDDQLAKGVVAYSTGDYARPLVVAILTNM